jgi:predicted DsbA family dithiol-disulfide isomerase
MDTAVDIDTDIHLDKDTDTDTDMDMDTDKIMSWAKQQGKTYDQFIKSLCNETFVR